jgi:hypothetical protein
MEVQSLLESFFELLACLLPDLAEPEQNFSASGRTDPEASLGSVTNGTATRTPSRR